MPYEQNFAVPYPACIISVSSSSLKTEYCTGVLVSIAIAQLSVFLLFFSHLAFSLNPLYSDRSVFPFLAAKVLSPSR